MTGGPGPTGSSPLPSPHNRPLLPGDTGQGTTPILKHSRCAPNTGLLGADCQEELPDLSSLPRSQGKAEQIIYQTHRYSARGRGPEGLSDPARFSQKKSPSVNVK